MGQALLPEHFYAQEQAIREEVHLRFRMHPLPSWGLGTLQWDGFQLVKGIISIQEMSLVLPTGTLIDIPGNTAPAFLNLNATAAKAKKTPVYVLLQSDFEVVAVGQGEAAEEGIERILQKVELSIDEYSDTSVQSFKLAEFEGAPDGSWSLSDDYVPPLLQIGSTPFFDPYKKRMDAIVNALRQLLKNELQKNHLAGDSQIAAKQCLRGLFAFQALLADLGGDIRCHPYELFRALRDLFIDVCIFRDISPAEIERPYEHEDLSGCFGALLEKLEEQSELERRDIPYVEFSRKDGIFTCELGKETKRSRDVFLLVQKPHVSSKLDLSRVKLASLSRLQMVYERALRGIPFERIEKPPFSHGLSSNVDFYTIMPGQEWDYAVREGKVVLYDSPHLEGSRIYLYWRTE
jgi:type VI secretion system protein ImpJ